VPNRLTIQYFALLKDQRGLDKETIESSASSARALYEELARAHGFTLPATALKVALNDDFANWDTSLSDGDSLAFIPPVAGG